MYKYSDDTLIHGVGVNFCAVESIMKNGISSVKYGKENDIAVNRNYFGSNLDDTISCVRYLYVNEDIEDSAYNKYVKNGVSFIIEDVPFISDKKERVIHRTDEVLVKDFIPKENIKGIIIPESLREKSFEELEYIREDSTSYVNIKHIADAISNYIKEKSGIKPDYNDFYIELFCLNEDYKKARSYEKERIESDFKETISDLNYEIGLDFYKCFSKVLNKKELSVLDVIEYINNETLKLPIYALGSEKTRKRF